MSLGEGEVGGKAEGNRLKEARFPPECEPGCRERAPVTLGHGGVKGQPGWRSAEKREGRGRVPSKCYPGKEMGKLRDQGPPPGQKAWPVGIPLTVARC